MSLPLQVSFCMKVSIKFVLRADWLGRQMYADPSISPDRKILLKTNTSRSMICGSLLSSRFYSTRSLVFVRHARMLLLTAALRPCMPTLDEGLMHQLDQSKIGASHKSSMSRRVAQRYVRSQSVRLTKTGRSIGEWCIGRSQRLYTPQYSQPWQLSIVIGVL